MDKFEKEEGMRRCRRGRAVDSKFSAQIHEENEVVAMTGPDPYKYKYPPHIALLQFVSMWVVVAGVLTFIISIRPEAPAVSTSSGPAQSY